MTSPQSTPHQSERPNHSGLLRSIKRSANSVGRRVKNTSKATLKLALAPVKIVINMCSMCSTSTLITSSEDEIISISIPNIRQRQSNRSGLNSGYSGSAATVQIPSNQIPSELNRKSNELPSLVKDPSEHQKPQAVSELSPITEETKIFKTNQDIPMTFLLTEFIREIIDIVKNTAYMKCSSYSPLLIFFYLKQNRNHLHEQWRTTISRNIEFHVSTADPNPVDMHRDVIEFLVAEALSPCPIMNYWLLRTESFQDAYAELYYSVINTLFQENKNNTRTEKIITLYCQVLRYVKDLITYAIQDLKEGSPCECTESHLFTDLLFNLRKSVGVSSFLAAEHTLSDKDVSAYDETEDVYVSSDDKPFGNSNEVPDPGAILENLMTSPLFQKLRAKNILDGTIQETSSGVLSPEEKKQLDSSISYVMRMGTPTPIVKCVSPKNN
ncbi:hypothetical protein NEPAR04_2307 [Nematocida parisii]|nr:hypothetical protein NEPAR04_2307 [Nematocida parisii]